MSLMLIAVPMVPLALGGVLWAAAQLERWLDK